MVWNLGTREGGAEEARTTFTVKDDKIALRALRNDLLARRAEGQSLLDETPPADSDPAFKTWDARVSTFYQELRTYLEQSPHLGKPEAMALALFHAEAPPLETAQIELSHFLERIDVLVARFGGETVARFGGETGV